MSADAPVSLEERFDALERVFGYLVEFLADTLSKMQLRLLALQTVLETKGVLTDPEVAAKIQALSDVAELELEYGNDPEVVRLRELRRFVNEKLAQQPPEKEDK